MGIVHFSSLVAPTSIETRSVLDKDKSGDSPRPMQACPDSKESCSPLTKNILKATKIQKPNTKIENVCWSWTIAQEDLTSFRIRTNQ